MINILVPIVENPKEFAQFINSKKSKNFKFFVGIKQNLLKDFSVKNKNIELRVFTDTSNKEEIINSLHSCEMSKGKILILRRIPTESEFEKLSNSDKDIVTLKASHNKFVTAMKNFVKKIIKKIFAFNYFEDISAICYSENMFELLSVCQNLSMASRINKYVGVEFEEIETTNKPVKKQHNRFVTALKFSLMTLVFLASLAGMICLFMFVDLKVLYGILIVMAFVLVLFVYLMSVMSFMRTLAVGNIHFGRAEEIIV